MILLRGVVIPSEVVSKDVVMGSVGSGLRASVVI